MTVNELYRTPGMYIIALGGAFCVIEITAEEKCYQCRPFHPFAQDGELDETGWHNPLGLITIGPFARKE